MSNGATSDWTPEMVAIVQQHHRVKTADEIGKMLVPKKSKNAVLGKIQRLGLAGEPNKSGKALHKRIMRRPIGSMGGRVISGCQWLDGEPRARDFCAKPVKLGSSYCPAHDAKAHKREKAILSD